MSRYLLIGFILLGFVSYSQQWRAEGPFYGKSKSRPYMHSMGLVDEVFPHPTDTNTFLMSTNSSGIWKTTDRGTTWKCVTETKELVPGMGVLSIEANPKNPNELFAAAGNFVFGIDSYGGSILHSKDWGDTWEILKSFDSVFKGNAVGQIEYHDTNLFAIGPREVLVSNDNGISWKYIFRLEVDEEYVSSRNQNISDFEVTPSGNLFISSSHLWGEKGNVWMGNGKDNKWVNLKLRSDFKEIAKEHILVIKSTTSKQGKVVIGFNNGKKIFLYQSNDQGKSFYKKGVLGLNWETGDAKSTKFEMEFSLVNPNKLYLGFIEFFEWDSIKGLKMLSPSRNISTHEHDDVRAMQVYEVGGKERVLMGNDGGISFYYPESRKFESLNGYNLPTLQAYNMAISQYDSNFTILIGTQDNGTFRYAKGEWNFIAGGDGGNNILNDNAYFQAHSLNSVVVLYKGKIKRYYSPNRNYSSWFINAPMKISYQDSLLLFGSGKLSGQKGARLYTQDLNEIIRGAQKGIVVEGMHKIGNIAVSENNKNIIWLAEGEHLDENDGTPKLIKTLDRGKSFIDLTDAPVYPDPYNEIPNRKKDTVSLRKLLSYRTATDIEIDPYNDDIVYISISGFFKPKSWTKPWEYYRVLKSEDGGETWYDYSYGLPITPIHCLLRDERDESVILCGGDNAVYSKSNVYHTWQKIEGNFPKNTAVSDLKLNYCQSRLYVSTYGRGVWSTEFHNKLDFVSYAGNQVYQYNRAVISYRNDSINSYRFIKKDLIIVKKRKTLTITSDIVLPPNASIVLEPKSKLIIDGGSISSACSEKWSGKIEIEEKRFLWVFKRKKGEVVLKNGGKINK